MCFVCLITPQLDVPFCNLFCGRGDPLGFCVFAPSVQVLLTAPGSHSVCRFEISPCNSFSLNYGECQSSSEKVAVAPDLCVLTGPVLSRTVAPCIRCSPSKITNELKVF